MNRIADILEVFYPNGLSSADYRGAIDKAIALLGRWERKGAAPKCEVVHVADAAVVPPPVAANAGVGHKSSRTIIRDALATGPKPISDIIPLVINSSDPGGLVATYLKNAVKCGEVVRVSRGIYALPSTPPRPKLPRPVTNRSIILDALKTGEMHIRDVAKLIHTTGDAYNMASVELSDGVKRGDLVRLSPGTYALAPKPLPQAVALPAPVVKPKTTFGEAIHGAIALREAQKNAEPAPEPREGTPGKRPYIDPHVSQHAIERYREHEPNASRDDVLRAIRYGVEIDPGVAVAMVGRNRVQDGNRYVLAPSFRGIFAIATNIRPETVATYLRFEATQEDFARRNYSTEMAQANGAAQ